MKAALRVIIFIFFASLAAIGQFSLISAWPSWFGQINLVLIFLIFTLFFFGFRVALWAAFVLGFWLDLISFQFFGFFIIVLLTTAGLAQLMLKNWLTNRSLYSFFVLILAATILYNFLVACLFYFTAADYTRFFLVQKDFWLALFEQGAWSLLAALLSYHLVAALNRKLQPFFLEPKRFS